MDTLTFSSRSEERGIAPEQDPDALEAEPTAAEPAAT
jgi:hypothetical protein